MSRLHALDSSSRGSGSVEGPRAAASRPGDPRLFLGGYWLLGQLALGERCTIHRARSIVAAGDRDQVAIKRLRIGQQDGAARARLLREARLGLGLRSPNLLRVLEIHDEPELFVVMEYVQGMTVRELLGLAQGRAALRHVLPMFVDALGGLSALHQRQDEEGAPGYLVHGAPSASHMLAGVDGVTRLIDLSHAHCRSFVSSAQSRALPATRAELPVLAPEQRAGCSDLDPRCDIFLVGSALSEVLERACNGSADAADEQRLRAQCAPLRAIAARASAVRRSDRFWSVDELAYQLQKTALAEDLYASRAAVSAWVRSVLSPARPTSGLPRVHPRLLDAGRTPAPFSARSARLPELLPSAARLSSVSGRASIPPPAPAPAPALSARVLPSVTPRAIPSLPAVREAVQHVPPRDSTPMPPATLASASGLRRVGSVVGVVALLTGAFVLGVRGLSATSTASAARPMSGAPLLLPSRALGSEREAEPRPVVTSLAPPPRSRPGAQRERASDKSPDARMAVMPNHGELISAEAGESTIDTIAAAIRVTSEESEKSLRSKNLFTRPRLLRAELPDNPY